MLKKLSLTVALLGAALSASSAQALSVYFIPGGGSTAADLNGTTIFENFESYALGATSYNGASVQAPPSNGTGAVPAFGSSGQFLSVRNGQSTTSVTIPVSPAQVLSFIIGSLDGFNEVTLTFLSGPAITYRGLAIITGNPADNGLPGNGSQTSTATNGRVFYDTQGTNTLTAFSFRSGGNAFEIDNISAAVPEPATWGMMILAAGMAGAALRRRRNVDAVA